MTTIAEALNPKGAGVVSAPRWEADEAVTQMYAAHYTSLVRLASLLLGRSGEAEEVVQDCFVAMHDRWRRLKEPDRALAYLRQAVINRTRSVLRHRAVIDRHAAGAVHEAESAEEMSVAADTQRLLLAGVRGLSQRQREVLVLRYYSDLSETQIAATLGISRGSVKTHAARGLTALRTMLEDQR